MSLGNTVGAVDGGWTGAARGIEDDLDDCEDWFGVATTGGSYMGVGAANAKRVDADAFGATRGKRSGFDGDKKLLLGKGD